MTTTIQPELDLDTFLDALAYPTPGPVTSLRARVAAAVTTAASEHGGYVTAAWVREVLVREASGENPGNWGHAYNALRTSGYLKGAFLPHGGPWYLPNGDAANKNGAKPARVYRLAKPIPPTWADGTQS